MMNYYSINLKNNCMHSSNSIYSQPKPLHYYSINLRRLIPGLLMVSLLQPTCSNGHQFQYQESIQSFHTPMPYSA